MDNPPTPCLDAPAQGGAWSSPSFAPDGERVVAAAPKGLYVATLPGLNSSCPDSAQVKVNLIELPGAKSPDWGPADPGPATPLRVSSAAKKLRSVLDEGLAVRATCGSTITVRQGTTKLATAKAACDKDTRIRFSRSVRSMRFLLPVLGLAFLAVASPAYAGDFYVSPSGSGSLCTEPHPCKTISAAVMAAADDDTIHIAAGTYAGGADTTKRLNFVGVGNDSFIDIPAQGNDPALTLRNGGSVTALKLRGQSSTGSSATGGGPGLLLRPAAASGSVSFTVTDVDATGGANIYPQAGIDIYGGDAPVRDVSVVITAGKLAQGTGSGGAGALFVGAERAVVDVKATQLVDALYISSASLVRVADVSSTGPVLLSRGRATIDRSRFVNETGAAVSAVASQGSARLTARDSLFAAVSKAPLQPSSTSAAVSLAGGDAAGEDTNATFINSTIFATGTGWKAALGATRHQTRPGSVDVKLVNTIVHRVGADAVNAFDIFASTGDGNGGVVDINAQYSAFRSVTGSGQATMPVVGSPTNVAADPQFGAAPTGTLVGADLGLQPTSPLIDAGDRTAPVADEQDLSGGARVLDGNGDCLAAPDIGAFERAGVACVPPQQKPPTEVPPAKDTAKPVISKLKVKSGKATLNLSEAAELTVIVERAKKGRKRGKRCVAGRRTGQACTTWVRVRKLSPSGRAGANSVALGRLAVAGYRVRVTATDAAGNAAKETSARFTVKKAKKKRA